MAEGQVPQRGVPLDQPLISAGMCQWSCVDLFGRALRKWKRQHGNIQSYPTVFNEFYVINLHDKYHMKFTCCYIALSFIFVNSCHFDCSLIIFVYTWFHSFNKILHKWRSFGFYIQTTHPFLNGNIINELKSYVEHLILLLMLECELLGLYSVSLHSLEWKITSYVEFIKRSIRNIF